MDVMMHTTPPVADSLLFENGSNYTTSEPYNLFINYTLQDLYAIHQPVINIVDKYVTPIWYIVGFPGNIMAIIVWIKPRMRHSSGCYLAALAMADFIFLILQLMFELQSTWNVRLLNIPYLCEGFPIFFLASQYLSPLLVLGFTVERYISICHPFQREKYCTTSRAIKVIMFLVIFCILLHAIQGYFWTYYQPPVDDCSVRQEVTYNGTKSLWSVWSWVTELLIFGMVPCVILLLNVLVIKEARKMKEAEEARTMCLKRGQKNTGPSATNFMLLAVSFYHIFTTLPVTVFYVLYFSFPEGNAYMSPADVYTDPTWQRHFTYWLIRTCVQELGMSHYACNFYIYFVTGKMFRKEVKRLCFAKFCKNQDRIWDSDLNDYRSSARTNHTTASNGAVAHV